MLRYTSAHLDSGPAVTLFPTSLLSLDDLGGRGRKVSVKLVTRR